MDDDVEFLKDKVVELEERLEELELENNLFEILEELCLKSGEEFNSKDELFKALSKNKML